MIELQPPIYIGTIRIGEPVTALTDILVAIVCFSVFFKLKSKSDSILFLYFRFYFLLLGLATLWGGIVTHAFIFYLSQPWKVPGWITSTWAISLLAFAMVNYHKDLVGKLYNTVIGLIILELVLVMSVIVYTVEFKWAGAHSTFGLFLIVGLLSGISYKKHKDSGSRWMLMAIGVFLVSGIVFSLKLSVNTWFNHVDLTHLLLAVAAYTMYEAVVEFQKLTNQQSTNLQ